MALKKESLLKFSKTVELVIKEIEDDSSGSGEIDEQTGQQDGTQVKILHLVTPVTATGSNTTRDGKPMQLRDNKVYIAGDDIEKFMADAEEKDNVIVYKGSMHLDVSRPRIRTNNQGVASVTQPAKLWLTSVKFSKRGTQLRQQGQQGLTNMLNGLFANGLVDNTIPVDPNAPTGTAGGPSTTPSTEDDKGAKPDPKVVKNNGAGAAKQNQSA